MEKKKEFGEGILHVITNYIYWLLMINLYFLFCNSLFLILFIMLQPDLSNLIIYFLALIPAGPAISALFYCLRKVAYEKECSPLKDFLRGYRFNAKDTMKFWLPLLLIFFILVVDLQYFYFKSTAAYGVLSILFLIGMALLLTCSLYAFMINVGFHFRTRDLFRLSVYYLVKNPKVTLKNVSIAVIALFVGLLTMNLLVLFGASLVCYLFMVNSKRVMEDIELNFCEPSKTHE